MEGSKVNQVWIVGSVYTDGDIGIAGIYMNEADSLTHYDRMEDRHFPGDGIQYNFLTHAPLYARNEQNND